MNKSLSYIRPKKSVMTGDRSTAQLARPEKSETTASKGTLLTDSCSLTGGAA